MSENISLRSLSIYAIGLFLISLGVAISVKSELGVSPVSANPYVLSEISNFSQGTWTVFMFVFFILLQAIILLRQFTAKHMLQIVTSTLFGYLVDFSNSIVAHITVGGYFSRLLLALFSIIILALGFYLYTSVNFIPMPSEGLVYAIQNKFLTNKSFGQIKTIVDILFVTFACLISYINLGRVIGVREGTLLTAILVGQIVHWFRIILDKVR